MKKKKSNTVRFTVEIEIDNAEGVQQFTRLVFALYNNGFQPQAMKLVKMMVASADEAGVELPPEVRAFAEHGLPVQ